MKRKRLYVEQQRLREKPGNEQSYGEYVAKSQTKDGEPIENIRANPDSLMEGQQLWGDCEMTRAQELMGEAIRHLQGRQKEVYELTMRDGKSLSEVGKVLSISKDTAKDYKERAVKFITAYCKSVLAKEESNEAL